MIDRIERCADRIAALTSRLVNDEPIVSAGLEIVREYAPEADGEQPAEPNLLGWSLDRRTLAFLARTGASVDVDEYHF